MAQNRHEVLFALDLEAQHAETVQLAVKGNSLY